MKTSGFIIVFLIAIITGLTIVLIRTRNDVKQIKPLRDSLVVLNDTLKNLTIDRQKIMSQNAIERAQFNDLTKGYKSIIAEKESIVRAYKRERDVVTVIDANPALKALISEMDSLDAIKTRRIIDLERFAHRMTVDMDAITANFEASLRFEQEKFRIATEIGNVYERELKKEKGKTLLWKILGGAGAAFGIWQGAKNASDWLE